MTGNTSAKNATSSRLPFVQLLQSFPIYGCRQPNASGTHRQIGAQLMKLIVTATRRETSVTDVPY